jgi:hypothetical protein
VLDETRDVLLVFDDEHSWRDARRAASGSEGVGQAPP